MKARSRIKLGVGILALTPAGVLAARLALGRLGANPIAEVLNQLGFWALILLLACLACTPLKIATGWKWPIALRRLLGLVSFTYAGLHLVTYVAVDQYFSWADIWQDVVKRKFMTVGFAAFLLLVPLAATSTSGMLKRLGAARWNRLHRLVYVAAILAIVHFVWRVKAGVREPYIYAAVLAALFLVRIVHGVRTRRIAARSESRPL